MAQFNYINSKDPEEKYILEAQVTANIHLVISVARRFQNCGLSLIDLINLGKLGLTRALENFDESMGFDVTDYAIWHIRQSMVQEMVGYQQSRPISLNKIGLLTTTQHSVIKPDFFFQHEPGIKDIESIKKFRMNITPAAIRTNNKYSEA